MDSSSFVLIWTLWNERNRRTFDDSKLVDQSILWSFMYMFLDWVRVHIGFSLLSLFDFIDCLGCK